MAQEWAAHNLKVVEGGIDFRHRSGVITFDTLFKPDSKPLEVLDRIVLRELEKRGHQIPHPFNDLAVKVYQNFAITDDAVIFFFAQGLVLSGEARTVSNAGAVGRRRGRRPGDDPRRHERRVEADEVFVMLSGSVTVEFADDRLSLQLGPDDVVSGWRPGSETVWTVTGRRAGVTTHLIDIPC